MIITFGILNSKLAYLLGNVDANLSFLVSSRVMSVCRTDRRMDGLARYCGILGWPRNKFITVVFTV